MMRKITAGIAGAVFGVIVGSVFGLYVGTKIGESLNPGNMIVYYSAGKTGLIAGAVFCAVCGFAITYNIAKKRNKDV